MSGLVFRVWLIQVRRFEFGVPEVETSFHMLERVLVLSGTALNSRMTA